MISSNTQNASSLITDPSSRNKMIVYGGIGISILSVILVLIFLINFLIKDNSIPQNPVPTIAPSNEPNVTSVTITPTSSLVNTNAKIAIKVDGDPTHGGSLWLMNYDKTNKVQVIKENIIDSIYSWSPDNRYLALTLIETQNSVSKRFVAVYDLIASGLIKSTTEIAVNEQIFWKDNNTLIAIKTNSSSSKKIFTFKLPEFNFTELTVNIDGANSSTFLFSNDLNWVIASNSNSEQVSDLILFNAQTQTKIKIIDLNLSTANDFSLLAWNNSNKFVYYTHEGFFELDPKNLQATQLFSITTNLEYSKPADTIRYNYDHSNLYFFISSKLYKYSFLSRTTKELFDINDLSLQTSQLNNFWISPSEKYLTLTAGVNPSYLVNLDNKKTIQLCELTCYDPVWQN